MLQLQYDSMSAHDRKLLLLHVLGINPVTEAKLRSGEMLLSEAMSERISEVLNNPEDTTQCAIVCQNIKRDGASFETLDATPYLEHINEMKARGGKFADDAMIDNFTGSTAGNVGGIPSGIKGTPIDTASAGTPFEAAQQVSRSTGIPLSRAVMYGPPESTYPHPFLRYFARLLDLSIYLLLVDLLFRLVFETDPLTNPRINMLWVYLVYVAMFAVEPLLIHFFGTTPGKFIFGVRLTDASSNKLSLKAAYQRSFNLLRYGYGFVIPIYNLYRLIKSFGSCKNKQLLTWDIGVKISRPDRVGAGRIIAFIAALFVLTSIDTYANILCELPRNRGDITEEEFYENCAHIVKYDSITFEDVPDYDVETTDGKVTRVSFSVNLSDEEYIYEYYNQIYVAFMAFAGAQENSGILSLNRSTMEPFRNCFADFTFDYSGVTVTNEVEYTGYARNILANYLYKTANAETHDFTQVFTLSK